jgi:hypothetical protein
MTLIGIHIIVSIGCGISKDYLKPRDGSRKTLSGKDFMWQPSKDRMHEPLIRHHRYSAAIPGAPFSLKM